MTDASPNMRRSAARSREATMRSEPHPAVAAIVAKRRTMRETLGGTQAETAAYRRRSHELHLRLIQAERTHGRAVWRFVICADCAGLRAISATGCRRPCETYTTLWLSLQRRRKPRHV